MKKIKFVCSGAKNFNIETYNIEIEVEDDEALIESIQGMCDRGQLRIGGNNIVATALTHLSYLKRYSFHNVLSMEVI